ncbi:methionyl-tRNA synthetase [Rhynchospora pubera]|uniref:Methionyl-tRNA synthetase n=1 Tax=Rhynchospora pubera TaxID=906938 RepID=A0AAV8AX06_9POAL|nr:methionyl-tRNA synthetase [Rhynchospora pubera]KAJ4753014.1 methionyl-tRNA synthetase [Rhynchospora pubera]KAJ4765116.1 methionyl-tRNA synthetase [Rhynchospora pubera]
MCVIWVCDEEEHVLTTWQAPGSCPYCGGAIIGADVQRAWRLCFVPICFSGRRRRFHCSFCNRPLVAVS